MDHGCKRKRFLLLGAIGVLLFPLLTFAANTLHWRPLSPGLDYTVIHPFPNSSREKVHAFQINLNRYKLSLVLAQNHQQRSFFVGPTAEKMNALIAINGGFFSPAFQPLGLRIKNSEILQPLKNTSWWGIFMIQGGRAKILAKQAYRYSKKIDFAVQAGPRLIVDGNIPKLKGKVAQRSAVGITKKGRVIIVITENLGLTTTQLATIMKQNLACDNALNLDGGSSSQLYAHVGEFDLNIRSIRPVTDMIIVTPL